MTRLATSAVRNSLGDTINRVAFKGERIVLERHGKAVAALVSVEDLSLLEALEDRADLADARRALQDPERIPYEEVRRKAGLV
jgi:prevent-host-death family protein